jgi:hypothetical protein
MKSSVRSALDPQSQPGVICIVSMLMGVACGGSVGPQEIPDVQGSWTYNETITGEGGDRTCTILGTIGLIQDVDTFVGSYIRTVRCSGVTSSPTTRSEAGSIPHGHLRESSIEFNLAECDYRGTITTRTPYRITGTTLCATLTGGELLLKTSAGSWLAVRLTEPSP